MRASPPSIRPYTTVPIIDSVKGWFKAMIYEKIFAENIPLTVSEQHAGNEEADMSLTEPDIRLLRMLTEREPGQTIDEVAERLARSTATVRRSIDALNRYLGPDMRIAVHAGRIERRPDYREFRQFLHTLDLGAYAPNPDERLRLMVVEALLRDHLNLAALYRELGLSTATKKSDARALRHWADGHGLAVRVLPRRGLAIEGEELALRILAAQALLPLIDLSPAGTARPRRANTPFDARCLEPLLAQTRGADVFWTGCLDELTAHFNGSISYASKKFLLLYLMVSALRIGTHPMGARTDAPVSLSDIALFCEPAEDRALNLVVSMLDFSPALALPIDRKLAAATASFFDAVQAEIITRIINRTDCERELYGYAYKQGLRMSRGVTFPDKMVRGTEQQMPLTYASIRRHTHLFDEALGCAFGREQCDTLALIFRKWANRSRLFGRNRKRVAIVTNTSKERIDFFIDTLHDTVEIEVTGVYDINEVNRLAHDDHELVLTFSDRVDGLVRAMGYRSLKVAFFLGHEDAQRLLEAGLSRSKRHYRADTFAAEVAGKSTEEIEALLHERYSETFA